jgi:hypothetical protein
VKLNSLPFPGWLRTATVPPMASQRRLAMNRPRPEPPYLRVFEASL